MRPWMRREALSWRTFGGGAEEAPVMIEEETEESFAMAELAANAGNSLETATPIEFDETVGGAITDNNKVDFYTFTLPSSGRLSLYAPAKFRYVEYDLYDVFGNQVDYWEPTWNSTTGEALTNTSIDLVAGVYYFSVKCNYGNYTGSYSLRFSFKSANESFAESLNRRNNSVETADTVAFGRTYNGQIAWNDTKDFYKITLPSSGRVTFTATTKTNRIWYYLYDASGNQLWSDAPSWNDMTHISVITPSWDLVGGIYYIVAQWYTASRSASM